MDRVWWLLGLHCIALLGINDIEPVGARERATYIEYDNVKEEIG